MGWEQFCNNFAKRNNWKWSPQDRLKFRQIDRSECREKNLDPTGSLTMKCAKVKAYSTLQYWISVSKKGLRVFATSGHLWKCKTNLSKSNSFRDMTFFSLVFQHFTVNWQIRVWKIFLAEKRSYLLNHLT